MKMLTRANIRRNFDMQMTDSSNLHCAVLLANASSVVLGEAVGNALLGVELSFHFRHGPHVIFCEFRTVQANLVLSSFHKRVAS